MKSGTVSIVGRPNSGKSTLVNALVGQKISIVSDKPQTTRHRILGVRTEERGQIAFVDTPGVHKPAYAMNRRMLRAVHAAVRDVDLVLLVVDASVRFGAGELTREKVWARPRGELPYGTAVVLSKFDESARTSRRKLVRIEADIIVEKNSQAAIIVGAGGLVLRDVGTAARLEIEELLDCRVYLRLRVRAVEKWRNSEAVLVE